MRHFAAMAGMDMNHMMGHWPRHGNEEIDFIPRADLFDTANEFVVHVSLPGAKKSDLSVEYDASHSTLRLRGVVHRPGMTEEMNRAFIFDERAFETGVFERKIRRNQFV
jgi:HSP20 family protein